MTTPLIPPGQITAADVLAETSAIRRDVVQLLIKVEAIDSRDVAQAAQLADHEARIRANEQRIPPQLGTRLAALERWQWRSAGGLAVLAVIAGLVGSVIEALIIHTH